MTSQLTASTQVQFSIGSGTSKGLTLEENSDDNRTPSQSYTDVNGGCVKIDDTTKAQLEYLDSLAWKTRYLRLFPSVAANIVCNPGGAVLGAVKESTELISFTVSGSEVQELAAGIVSGTIVSTFLLDSTGASLPSSVLSLQIDPAGLETRVLFTQECYGTVTVSATRRYRTVVVTAPSNSYKGVVYVAAFYNGQVASANVGYTPLTTSAACNDPTDPSYPTDPDNTGGPDNDGGCTYDENGCVISIPPGDCQNKDTCGAVPELPEEPPPTPCQWFQGESINVIPTKGTVSKGEKVSLKISTYGNPPPGTNMSLPCTVQANLYGESAYNGSTTVFTGETSYVSFNAPQKEGSLEIDVFGCGGDAYGGAWVTVLGDQECYDLNGDPVACDPTKCYDTTGHEIDCGNSDEGFQWEEVNRITSDINIGGALIARIDKVTFKPLQPDANGQTTNMTLIFHNPLATG